uniref:NADH-ubiquinone oxidoreductase chain 6 n=1 Tax=Benthodytes marianensis TaxID=2502088 RepID=A0A3S5HWS4_9ECHN|nr:NADH dehydrogenase subunit 6 [Benthodytes marianensis]AZZ06736.1 NADH dehydrogenase subunit 6 [Benthodytes marianensis]
MIIYSLLLFLLLGSTLVFYSLSPYYAAVGLVITAFFGCITLSVIGLSFIALLFFLIYMGGMLVVFIYSSALSAERFPKVSNLVDVITLFILITLWIFAVYEPFMEMNLTLNTFNVHSDLNALSGLYSEGGIYLLWGGLALLVILVVVLILSLGESVTTLRSI